MHIGNFNGRITYATANTPAPNLSACMANDATPRKPHLRPIFPTAWRMTHATATPSATLEANVPAVMTLMNILPFI